MLKLKTTHLGERTFSFWHRVFVDRQKLFWGNNDDVGIGLKNSHLEAVLLAQHFLLQCIKIHDIVLHERPKVFVLQILRPNQFQFMSLENTNQSWSACVNKQSVDGGIFVLNSFSLSLLKFVER